MLRKPPLRPARIPRSRLIALWLLFSLVLAFLLMRGGTSLVALPAPAPLHLLVAYDSVPHGTDGAERYLASIVRALAGLPVPTRPRITFIARSTADACRALPADSEALGADVSIREAAPTSPEFLRLLSQPNTALLLPLSFFSSCAGAGANASSEAYSAALRSLQAGSPACWASPCARTPLAVFAFDAQAFRLQGLADNDPHAAQAARFAAAAAAEGAREAALYARADVFAMLTQEDLAAVPPTRPGVPRLVINFRDDVEVLLADPALPPAERAARHAATLAPFEARAGFVFMGGGNNPTNVLALHAFLTRVWPVVRLRLPSATLHIIGSPPSRLCAEHGVWCGWLADTPYSGAPPEASGIHVHGLVEDPRSVLSKARVALAPLVCGTGINTKTGFYMANGLPVVGTEKGVRGYGPAAGLGGGGGYAAAPLEDADAFASACERLHEDRDAWTAASLGALERTARLEDERAKAEDLQALLAALRAARGAQEGKERS